MSPSLAHPVGASHPVDVGGSVLSVLQGDRVAAMLFGSHARGDAHAASDIDILQLVERWRPSYVHGRISVSVYTVEHLRDLARAGSLFVLHLVTEGRTLDDPSGQLLRVLTHYRAPASYHRVRENLCRASSVLDVDARGFQHNPAGFLRVAFYLLRTALYVRCVELGTPVFAMRRVAQRLGQPRIAELFDRRGCVSFDTFDEVRTFLWREIGASGVNEFRTLEAMSVALHVSCPIASKLALKLLAGHEQMDYDSTFLDWSHHG